MNDQQLLLMQIGEESAAAVDILQRHGLWPTSGFVGIVSVAQVLVHLEAEADEWVDLAALHDAEIKGQRAENQSHLETLYKFSSDMMAAEGKIAALAAENEFLRGWLRGELTLADVDIDAEMQRHGVDPTPQVAIVADLTAKLSAANAELHDLRIKTQWQPTTGHFNDAEGAGDTLTVDGRYLVMNAGRSNNLAVALPPGVRLCCKT